MGGVAPAGLIAQLWLRGYKGAMSDFALENPNTGQSEETFTRITDAERDDIRVLFTVENGRATGLTMHQVGREISGPRKP